ncbi:hypothetical protein JMJ35_007532 [Cladonia borealis]|uniref:DNA-directed RNA polymerase subunit n=1 Tax=Cladonia borealis TaxID=184061 RepID=A0AA39QVX0_9LECA|nr:hypothetical protein JMJ35_007532 [Cladonia borealis]
MLLFCPLCSNCLTVSRSSNHTTEFPSGQNRLECRTCPYQFLIDKKYYERKEMKRKEVEDVMGGANAWENVDKADAQCPREGCDGSQAFFYQVQIRSADEPMTTFYKCTTCAQRWKEN